MPNINCDLCGTPKAYTPSELRKPAAYRFCSRLCQNTHQARRSAILKRQRAIDSRVVTEQPVSYRLIQLNGGSLTKLDTVDYEFAMQWAWFKHTGGYTHNGRRGYLHRMVLERKLGRPLVTGEVVDHINHDKLDNRRKNLRLATVAMNGGNMKMPSHNTSGFKGVQYKPEACKSRPYLAAIKVDQKNIFIGFFLTAEECAYVYDQVALQMFGDYAHTNFKY